MKKKNISFWIKSLIFLSAAGLLYYILDKNENLDRDYLSQLQEGYRNHAGLLIVAVLLIPLNWSLEAYKWKRLIEKVETISFGKALEGVIAGVTMGFITPHSLGDYAARILTLSGRERFRGVGAVFLSRISQFYITLYFGTVALAFYVYKVIQVEGLNYQLILWFTVVSNILFSLIFIYHKIILNYLDRIKIASRIVPYISIIKAYSFREINIVFALSFFRYLIFCIQFILILLSFDIVLSLWLLFIGVSFVFFLKSVVPTFLDLGVRETAAVIFFGVFNYNHERIIFASLTLWLLNLVIPALVGLVLVYRIRLFNK